MNNKKENIEKAKKMLENEIYYNFSIENVKKELINRLIKNNYNVEKTITETVKEGQVKSEMEKIKQREKQRKIREEAEKRLYGKTNTKRQKFTENQKNMILNKFENQCAVCGKTEGLHIHHKDKNTKNNRMNNLIVLCGVCHKKIHMKIR
jgi:5-methylcytosine-specific restriction endonuclease McrA